MKPTESSAIDYFSPMCDEHAMERIRRKLDFEIAMPRNSWKAKTASSFVEDLRLARPLSLTSRLAMLIAQRFLTHWSEAKLVGYEIRIREEGASTFFEFRHPKGD